jgi:hypothetical protein
VVSRCGGLARFTRRLDKDIQCKWFWEGLVGFEQLGVVVDRPSVERVVMGKACRGSVRRVG